MQTQYCPNSLDIFFSHEVIVDSTSIFSLVNFPCLFLLVEAYDPLMLKHFNLQIVDLATLTGACIIALGNEIGGQSHSFNDLHCPLALYCLYRVR